MRVLRGREKALFRIGGVLVKVARANRNGEVVLVVADDDSSESGHALMQHRLPEETRREDRLPTIPPVITDPLEMALA